VVALLVIFPSLTSLLTRPLSSLQSAAHSGTLTGNQVIDNSVGALPIDGLAKGIDAFPNWVKAEVPALPRQVAPVDSWTAKIVPGANNSWSMPP
jgi:hypothetical protein